MKVTLIKLIYVMAHNFSQKAFIGWDSQMKLGRVRTPRCQALAIIGTKTLN